MSRQWLTLVVLLALGSAAAARNITWKPNEKPPISLEQALQLAEPKVKAEQAEFYCLGASIAKNFSQADWELQYGSASGKQLWVSVGSDRQIRVSHAGFSYK